MTPAGSTAGMTESTQLGDGQRGGGGLAKSGNPASVRSGRGPEQGSSEAVHAARSDSRSPRDRAWREAFPVGLDADRSLSCSQAQPSSAGPLSGLREVAIGCSMLPVLAATHSAIGAALNEGSKAVEEWSQQRERQNAGCQSCRRCRRVYAPWPSRAPRWRALSLAKWSWCCSLDIAVTANGESRWLRSLPTRPGLRRRGERRVKGTRPHRRALPLCRRSRTPVSSRSPKSRRPGPR